MIGRAEWGENVSVAFRFVASSFWLHTIIIIIIIMVHIWYRKSHWLRRQHTTDDKVVGTAPTLCVHSLPRTERMRMKMAHTDDQQKSQIYPERKIYGVWISGGSYVNTNVSLSDVCSVRCVCTRFTCFYFEYNHFSFLLPRSVSHFFFFRREEFRVCVSSAAIAMVFLNKNDDEKS